ncbi:ABC transporter permease subunit [Paenibacillus rhizoplanae]
MPIVVALLLNEMRGQKLKRVLQTAMYLPYFLSWVVLGGIILDVLSLEGVINSLIQAFGGEPVGFLSSNRLFPGVLVTTEVWKNFGFNTIIYMAALTSINPDLYEAAMIDGASRWRQIWHVTLPGIRPTIILLATLSLGNVLNAGFEQVFMLLNPLVVDSGDILDTLVYRLAFNQAQYSVATAVGLFKSLVSGVLISVSYYMAYKFADYRIFLKGGARGEIPFERQHRVRSIQQSVSHSLGNPLHCADCQYVSHFLQLRLGGGDGEGTVFFRRTFHWTLINLSLPVRNF